ncbi:hypothetical protein V6O07_16380, partial [Arthrospira platensis SPKY2]
ETPGLTFGEREEYVWLRKEELLDWAPARDPAKPYPPRPAQPSASAAAPGPATPPGKPEGPR